MTPSIVSKPALANGVDDRKAVIATLAYLFPGIAMLVGAWLGASFDGTDGATALGAMAGFLGALAVVRIAIGLMPAQPAIYSTNHSHVFQQEFHHER